MRVHHWVFIAAVVIAFIAYRAKKLGYFDKKDHAEAGVIVAESYLGKWEGQLQPATSGAWGSANDEHDPAYTAQVLAGRPDWLGLGYCPGGSFSFEVQADGGITGAANIYGHACPVQGRPVLAAGAMEIEFTVLAHMVKLKFDGGAVTGLLWEGHDPLKRANVVGKRA
jgi:hypothetical protein